MSGLPVVISLEQGYVRLCNSTEGKACVLKNTFKGHSSKEVETEQIVDSY